MLIKSEAIEFGAFLFMFAVPFEGGSEKFKNQDLTYLAFWAAARQGTKSCRIRRNSVRPSGRTSVRLSLRTSPSSG